MRIFSLSLFILLILHVSRGELPTDVDNSLFNRSIANTIRNQVKVLCWVLTTADHHTTRALHIRNTWGRRCNTLLFMSTVQDPDLPSIALPIKEGPGQQWNTVKDAFRYIYKYHYGNADWFMKVDDDTYVIMENLRYLLYGLSSNEPVFLGHQMKRARPPVKSRNKQSTMEHIYMSGGSGYVLSKEALRKFVEVAFFNPALCQHELDSQFADLEMGLCMKALKVLPIDTRDDNGKDRFMDIHPQYLLTPIISQDFISYSQSSVFNVSQGLDCCSVNPISFHQVKPQEMYLLEFILYHMRAFGVSYSSNPPTLKNVNPINSTTGI